MKLLKIKNLALTATSFLLANIALAQNNQTFHTSIYFASNSHALDGQASKTLNDFLQQLQTMPDFELDVRAYTDDVGSEDYNKKLAAQRAQSITQFLEKQQLAISRQEIEGVGELQLQANGNAETQRRQNRRVDIVVSLFRPESINDLFAYFAQRNRTMRTINSREPQIVTGKQGTIFQIPADAFERKDGKPVQNPVQIEIREAYTYADMVALNLTTHTPDGGLETGGMTYIAATDADGTPLQLKANASLQLMMPSARQLPKDMALYTSARTGNDNAAPSIWEARNVPFTPIPEKIYAPYQPTMNQLLPLKADKIPVFPQVALAAPSKPSVPSLRKPIFNTPRPDINACRSRTPRKLFESAKAHEQRIAELYAEEEKDYAQSKINYDRSLANYYRAADDYLASERRYKNDSIAFFRYVDSVKAYYHDFRRINDISNLNQRLRHNVSCTNRQTPFNQPLLGLIAQCQQFKLTELGAETASLFNSLQSPNKSHETEGKKLKQELESLIKLYPVHPILTLNEFTPNAKSQNGGMHEAADWCKKVEKFHTQTGAKLLNDMEHINRQLAMLDTKCKQFEQKHNNKDITALTRKLQNLIERIDQARTKAGYTNVNDLRNQFYSLTTVNNFPDMGWVNCDKPLTIQEPIYFTLQLPHDANTQFYVVRKDRPSVADVAYLPAKKVYNIRTNTLPPSTPVKLVALRVRDNKAEYCIKEGISDRLNGINQLEFQPTTINDLYKILNTI